MSKTVLITGAAGNLGSAVDKKLSRDNHKIIRLVEPSQYQEAEHWHAVDLSSPTDTKALFSKLRNRYDRIDAAVLTVGGFAMSNIGNATIEDLNAMWQLNFLTAFNATQPLYEWMKETGGGHLIFVGAKPAVEGGGFETLAYTLSKSTVIKLAEILNEKTSQSGVKASVIVPSIIDTPPNREAMPDGSFEQWVSPEQIAGTISFMLSGEGGSIRNLLWKTYNQS